MSRLPDEMQWIVDQLERGVVLHGPVRVWTPTGTAPRPWGFSDGKRACKYSVDGLARRGIISIRDGGGKRSAELR